MRIIQTLILILILLLVISEGVIASEPEAYANKITWSWETEMFSGRDLDDAVKTLCGMESRHSVSGELNFLRVGYKFSENLTADLYLGRARVGIIDRPDGGGRPENALGGGVTLNYPINQNWDVNGNFRYIRLKPTEYVAASGIRGINSFSFLWEEWRGEMGVARKFTDLTVFLGGCYNFNDVSISMDNSACGCVVIDRSVSSQQPLNGQVGLRTQLTESVQGSWICTFGGESNLAIRFDYCP